MQSVKPDAPLVYICSPYRADTPEGVQENLDNVKRYFRFALDMGYAPLATHFAVCSILDDNKPEERNAGISLDTRYLSMCEELWVFGSRISEGMRHEIEAFRNERHNTRKIRYFDTDCNPLRMTNTAQEAIAMASKAANAWRNTHEYQQAAAIIDILIRELEKMGARPLSEPMTPRE